MRFIRPARLGAIVVQNITIRTWVPTIIPASSSMKILVKGPDINESELNFTVNKKGEILFGLGGIKGVEDSAGGVCRRCS